MITYTYMCICVHIYTNIYTHTYMYMAVGLVTHRNAKPTTAHYTSRRRYLQIISNHRAIHLRWSSNGCGLDRCRPVLLTTAGIWTGLVISSQSPISEKFVSFDIVEIINLLVCVFWFRNFLLISHVFNLFFFYLFPIGLFSWICVHYFFIFYLFLH